MGQLRARRETLPEHVWQQIRAGYLRGYCFQHLSREFGIDAQALSKWLKGEQAPSRHVTGYERLEDLKDAVLEDYREEGVGMRELRKRFGVHEGTMRSFLQAQGVLKERGAQPGAHNPQSKAGRVESKERDAGKYWARRVVEKALGEPLPKGWVIHHMNECPMDQTLTNLWLFPGNGQHSLYHQSLRRSLAEGGQLAPSRLASDNGGLWLPQILDRLQSAPGTALQTLFEMQGWPVPGRRSSEPVAA